MDLSSATDNEIIAEVQRRKLHADIADDTDDEIIIRQVYNRGITADEIWDPDDDDREPDHGPEDAYLDGMIEDRMEFDGGGDPAF
jgi:hypothetical protein